MILETSSSKKRKKTILPNQKKHKNFIVSFIIYESRGDKNKTLSIDEYLNKIRAYLKYIINDLKRKYHTWKIQLTIAINFMSSKDNDEELVIHSRNDNIELINDKLLMIIDKIIEEIVEKRFQSHLSRYQFGLETSMKVSDFIFDCVNLLQYKYVIE